MDHGNDIQSIDSDFGERHIDRPSEIHDRVHDRYPYVYPWHYVHRMRDRPLDVCAYQES